MSQAVSSFKQKRYDPGVARVDAKFEVALIPVSDVERAKEGRTAEVNDHPLVTVKDEETTIAKKRSLRRNK
jgi:hypothetical protein